MMPRGPETTPLGAHQVRLGLFYLVIGICVCALVAGLFYRQLILKEAYDEATQRQNYRRILMPGPRGDIFDRNGQLLVGNRPLFSAVVYLNELRPEFRRAFYRLLNERRAQGIQPDRHQLAIEARRAVVQEYQHRINRILGRRDSVDSTRLERHFSQSLLLPFPLLRDLTLEDYARLIEQVSIDSPIQVIADTARYYPHGAAAAHTLGFVSDSRELPGDGLAGDSLLTFRFEGKVGRSGLEAYFNDHLQGQTGGEIWSVDPGGFTHQRVVHEQPQRGNDLHVTLDIEMQRVAEAALGTKAGAVVAIHIATGEVLALASKPGYDLNDFSPFLSTATDRRIREQGAWLNRAIQGLYPPGSTFKLITAIAGLRSGHITDTTAVYCGGFHMVGSRIFRCHNRAGHGTEDLVAAIRDSCNVLFYERGIAMGVRTIAAEARRFMLDQPSGIELPGETRSMLVPDPDWKRRRLYGESWFEGDTANLSIGQGFLLVTPLQMAAFTAALARGTTSVNPTLLKATVGNPPPRAERPAPQPIGLPEAQRALIIEGMRAAGLTGTARQASTPQIAAAGKTGTAQVRKDGRPTTLAWFVGFAPADRPTVAVAVMVEGVPEEETSYAGGSTAAPIARQVFALSPRYR
jgi:penicillin-binding protein 2